VSTLQPTLTIEGEADDVLEYYMNHGWTDGLPVVSPTVELVERMLAAADRDPEETLPPLPPSRTAPTVHAVAVNAVMAGCRPEYFPVVLAAVEAVADPVLDLYGLQATTSPVAVLLMVNGPIAARLQINSMGNCLGPGFRANATIGRAVQLVALNVGGGTPQTMDKATHGQPGKFTLCFAENEQDSPWEPWHVEHGFALDADTVTAISVTGTQNVLDGCSKTARELLQTFASSCAHVGAQNAQLGGWPLIIFSPEHAQIIARDGYTKTDVKQALYEQSRVPVHQYPADMLRYKVFHNRPRKMWSDDPGVGLPFADTAEDVNIVVAGGAGPHSVFCPSFGLPSSPVIRAISAARQ
jgi:hypothetical protein